jgi:hypothetical protein
MSTRILWRYPLASLALLAGCGTLAPTGGEAPSVPAPVYHVGDRWTYQAQDGFLRKTEWVETHEVLAASSAGINVRVKQTGGSVSERNEQLAAPGQVLVGALSDHETRRFATPLQRWNFPLASGLTWSQWIDNRNETTDTRGVINHYVRVGGWEKVTTAAGTFDAIRLSIYMQLDDEDPSRWPTHRVDVAWYAPAVRGIVREEREAYYLDKGDVAGAAHQVQHAVLELSAFTPGSK